jgi:hypothetical protein
VVSQVISYKGDDRTVAAVCDRRQCCVIPAASISADLFRVFREMPWCVAGNRRGRMVRVSPGPALRGRGAELA